MAKVLFGGGVAEMRRSLEGNTFSRNKGGSYVRQRVRPTNPQTLPQQEQRDRLAQLSKDWGTVLSEAQRTAWTDFAAINTVVDVLGQTLQLSGIQMYIKLNNRILQGEGTRIDDPPANLDVTQLTSITAAFDTTGGTYEITFSPVSTDPNEVLQVESTPSLSPGISFIKNRKRLIDVTGDPTTTATLDEVGNWQSVFGILPPIGNKIVTQIRVMNKTNGAISVALREDSIIT